MRIKSLAAFALAAASAFTLAGVSASPASAVLVPTSSISFTSSTMAKIGVYNWLSVSIGSSDGTTRADGSVQFFNTAGALVGVATTTPSGVAGATASIPWIPTEQTTYSFNATFLPSATAGIAGSSTSVPITILATPDGQVVSIAAQQMWVGVPTTVTATVYPATLTGSVGFSTNQAGYGVGPSVPVVNGTASQTFVPTGVGWQQFLVSFTSNDGKTQGAAGQWVNVLPAIAIDTPVFSGVPASIANGSSAALTVTAPVGVPAVSAVGGCFAAGTTIHATTGSGFCVVNAQGAGGNGYRPGNASVSIPLTPGTQTAKVAAPSARSQKVGTAVTLARADTVTNIGNPLRWALIKGNAACSLTRASKVTLAFTAAGSCRVRAYAAGVPGEFGPYERFWTYTAK